MVGVLVKNIVTWSCAESTLPGQSQSGDGYVVLTIGNRVLLAAVSGLGQNAEAALAVKRAVSEIREYVGDESLMSVVRRCHARLRETSGAALNLALFQPDNSTVTWIGVGNIEGILLRSKTATTRQPETLQLRAGIVGSRLPGLVTSTVPVLMGDILVFATDGIERNFIEGLHVDDDPQRLCDRIIARYGKKTDNALVLAARYLG